MKREFSVDSIVHGPFERSAGIAPIRVFMETATFGLCSPVASHD